MKKSSLQIPGAFIVFLFIVIGGTFVAFDLKNLAERQIRQIEQLATATSNSLAGSIPSSSHPSSWTQDETLYWKQRLIQAQVELNIRGFLSLVNIQVSPPEILVSTNAEISKGSLFTHPVAQFDPRRSFMEAKAVSSGLYRQWGDFWLATLVPIRGAEGQTFGVLNLEINATDIFFHWMGYALNYVLLLIALLTLGSWIYSRKIKAAQQSLVNTTANYQTLFSETTDAVILLRSDCLVQSTNQAAASIFEKAPEELVGTSLLTIKQGSQSPSSEALPLFQPLKPDQSISALTINEGIRFRSKAKLLFADDRVKYVSYSSSPLKEQNEIVGAVIILQDITADVMREQELIIQQSRLAEQNEKLQEQIITDPLTQCLNKQYLQHFISDQNIEWRKAEGCSMLLIDIDNFKNINDKRGHVIGDLVLQEFGHHLRQHFRRSDKVIRFGGDEFIVLLPQSDIRTAAKLAQNLLQSLQQTSNDVLNKITLSIGVAELQNRESGKQWLERADQALYNVKQNGKNGYAVDAQ